MSVQFLTLPPLTTVVGGQQWQSINSESSSSIRQVFTRSQASAAPRCCGRTVGDSVTWLSANCSTDSLPCSYRSLHLISRSPGDRVVVVGVWEMSFHHSWQAPSPRHPWVSHLVQWSTPEPLPASLVGHHHTEAHRHQPQRLVQIPFLDCISGIPSALECTLVSSTSKSGSTHYWGA